MKAVVLREIGGPQALRTERVARPAPAPGEARIALKAAAINRREVWISLGRYMDIRLPCILGADGAGVVESVGEGVDPALLGREVVIYPAFDWGEDPRAAGRDFRVLGMPQPGTFAQYICMPAGHLYDKPAHLTWQQAAALPLCGLTAWRAVTTQAGIGPGQRVLVTGIGGGVASTALLLAVHAGAEVWVTSSQPDKIERALALGARGGVSYREADWGRRLRSEAGSMDAVIDGTVGADFSECLETLGRGGRLVIYGATAGKPVAPPDPFRLFLYQLQVRGSTMGSPAEFGAMLDFVADRRLVPVVDAVYTLDDAIAAHRRVLEAGQMGKVVFDIAG
ncbi:MAG: zinc-binding dehydrogenase [Gammaproteobacteria bacterium]|nr:zinc-binding dehydrogenase [Gammaproteobacteria bacterium]